MKPPSRSDWLYSGKALLAALLAFYAALVIQLPNPYWSFATVYIVSHPLTGATRSKAMYRALGTLLGAAVAVAIVPPLADQPMTLIAAIAGWTALSLYLSLRDATPSAYVFLLASYTTPLVAIPSVVAPAGVFDLAMARSEEILLGIVCASLVSTVIFPARVIPVFNARVATLLRDASNWTALRLKADPYQPAPKQRFNLLNDITSLDALITHLNYDALHSRQTRDARRIRYRMTMLIPAVASLSDALEQLDPSLRARHFDDLLGRLLQWISLGYEGSTESGQAQREAMRTVRSTSAGSSPQELAVANAAERMIDVIDLWSDCLMLVRTVNVHRRTRPHLNYRLPMPDHRSRHYEHRLMLYAALSPALAVLLSGWIWLYSGWPLAGSGVVMIAVASAFFASADSPAPLVARFFLWEAISVLVAGTYTFLILPQITTFAGVAVALAPPLLIVGTFTGRPTFNTGVLLLTSQTISDLAIGNHLSANFEIFVNSSLGMLAGLVFAIVWNAVARPFGTEIAAGRLAEATWRDQLKLVDPGYRGEITEALARAVDRTAQWLPRLAMTSGEPLMSMAAVRDLCVSLALIDLRAHMETEAEAPQLVEILEASERHFEQCLDQRRSLPPDEEILSLIDQAIANGPKPFASDLLRYRIALLSGHSRQQQDEQFPLTSSFQH